MTATTITHVLTTLVAMTAISAGVEPLSAQADSTLAQDGIYNRPFIGSISSTSIGGYVEGNTNYFVEDGVSEGFSMELRRFNIFLFAQVSQRIRFLSELEFEHGTEEITLETALVDFQLGRGLVLRGGIILVPLGYLNQNHDSPRWDFVERPLVTTDIIPSTLSEVGFGANGRFASGELVFSYDAYLTNGLGAAVLTNETGRTDIPSGKNEELFGEDNNGSPTFSGRFARSAHGARRGRRLVLRRLLQRLPGRGRAGRRETLAGHRRARLRRRHRPRLDTG